MSNAMFARLRAISAGHELRIHDGITGALQRRGLIHWRRPNPDGHALWVVTDSGKEALAQQGGAR
jgi:hypothetical protein